MSELFEKVRTTITEHIKNIFDEEKLVEKVVCRKSRQVRTESKSTIKREIEHYSLDFII